MQHSFMWQDVRNILLALPLFFPYLFAPGYAAGFLLDVFSFRTQALRTRMALSLALSLAVLPIAANLLARLMSLQLCAWLLLGVSISACAGCVLFEVLRGSMRPRVAAPHRVSSGWIIALGAAWVLLCLVSFPDLQIGHTLWNSVMIYDEGIRSAFIDAVLRTGVPPRNPLCFFGTPVPSRYYYYWSTVCALPAALGHLPARAVLAASSIWSGFALSASISLFLRFFLRAERRLQRWTLLGTALLAITGLDLIPTAISWFTQGFVRADMEWWDGTEIPSWVDSVLWTPHHIDGMLCCLTGLLLLWPVYSFAFTINGASGPVRFRFREHATNMVLAGLAFASAAGLSAYLSFCFALFILVWMIRLLFLRRFRAFLPFVLAGSLALLLSVPLLHDLRQPAAQQMDTRTGKRAHLITTGLRTSGWIKAHVSPHHLWRTPLLLLDCAATYVLEFGFFLLVFFVVAAHLRRRRLRLSEAQVALCYMLGTALVVVTFLRSEAIKSNDLGMRSALLAQWVLLLWAIPLLDRMILRRRASVRRGLGFLLSASLLLGLCASIYQVLMLRFAAPLDAISGSMQRPIPDLPVPVGGRIVFEVHSGEAALQPLLGPRTVVAYDPFNDDRLLLLYNTHAQIAASSPKDCGTPFGGSIAACDHTKAVLRKIFAVGVPPVAVDDLDRACRAAAIDVLLVQSSDPVWSMPASWVWRRPTVVANPSLRAMRCGGSPQP